MHARLALIAMLIFVLPAVGQEAQKRSPIPPALASFLAMDVDELLQRFDRNSDRVLTTDEFPPRLARLFERADTNHDGKLDRRELETLLRRMRQRFGLAAAPVRRPGRPAETHSPAEAAEADQIAARFLERLDVNRDGKISREEARGPLAEHFQRLDRNNDGFLDRQELRTAAVRMLRRRKESGVGVQTSRTPDFDALDANADGRLTRDEINGTAWAERFDEIDANRDGRIDRKEFEAYWQKQAARDPKQRDDPAVKSQSRR